MVEYFEHQGTFKSKHFGSYINNVTLVTQPARTNSSCVAAVVYTRTRIRWITVPCDHQFNNVLLLCETKQAHNIRNENDSILPSINATKKILSRQPVECSPGWINVGNLCYKMVDFARNRIFKCSALNDVCQAAGGKSGVYDPDNAPTTSSLVLYFRQWLDFPMEEIFYQVVTSKTETSCTATTFLETEYPTLTLSATESVSGLVEVRKVFCQNDLLVTTQHCLANQFTCGDGTCILIHYHCDGIVDCPDSTDEISCEHACQLSKDPEKTMYDTVSQMPKQACFKACFPETCTCSELYFHCKKSTMCVPASKLCDGHADCPENEDEMFCQTEKAEHVFQIHQSQVSDGTSNEIYVERTDLFSTNVTDAVSSRTEMICEPGFTYCTKGSSYDKKCFPMNAVCLFERSKYEVLRYCPNGEHLRGCTRHLCPSEFKCSLSYCVPLHYVCNGKIDCPDGEDEDDCPKSCPGLLRCRHDAVCVHSNYVKDMRYDCLASRDDEILNHFDECPKISNCRCLGRALSCISANLVTIPHGIGNFKTITLRRNKLQQLSVKMHLPFLVILDLSYNMLASVLELKSMFLPRLVMLELACNLIIRLESNVFLGMGHLRYLNLTNNSIDGISEGAFSGLTDLTVLDLSQNPLQSITPQDIKGIKESLLHFIFRKNTVTDQVLSTVDHFSHLRVFSTDLASYCPYVPNRIKCDYAIIDYISCCQLINNYLLSVLIWTFVVTSLMLNIVCIIFVAFTTGNPIAKLLAIFIHVSDTIIVCYFLAFSALNRVYHNTYLRHRQTLLAGVMCQVLGSMLAISDGLSLISTVLNCCQRFYVVVFPLRSINSSLKWYIASFLISLVSLILIILIPRSVYTGNVLMGIPCFVVPISGRQTPLLTYYLPFYMSLNFVTRFSSVALISLLSWKLDRRESILKGSRTGGEGVKLRVIRKSYLHLAENLFGFFTLCIVQTVLMYIPLDSGTMAGISLSLYVRCLLNPILYTLSTTNFIAKLVTQHTKHGVVGV